MSQQELLSAVVQALVAEDIDYMLTGSVVSSLQGEPRSTHDIDLVVALRDADVKALLRSFPPPDYYLDEHSVREAMSRQSMFNLIDVTGGEKVDFWMLTRNAFDRSRFSRRYVEEAVGIKMYVSSPEDTILAKLRWAAKCGGSEKQFTDALRVFEVQRVRLDMEYVDRWATELHVVELWERLQKEAEII